MPEPDWAVAARIERSRGRTGEVYARSLSGGPERFLGNEFHLRGVAHASPVRVTAAWLHQGRLVLKFEGIDTISDAEKLRGAELAVPLARRAPLEEGEVYLADLAGSRVIAAGREIGVVESWQETGGPVLIVVRSTGGGEILIPFARSIFKRIDLERREVEVDLPEGLAELNQP